MVAIQIREVSDETRAVLAAEAESRGQSLQAFLHEVLEREAASARNLAWLRRTQHRPPMVRHEVDIPQLIRNGRQERTRRILDAAGFPDVPAEG